MLWTNIRRILKIGLINFWRNGLVSLASVLAMTVTLFVIGSIYLGTNFLDSALNEVKSKVDISISFKTDASETEIKVFQKDLSLLPEVKETVYSSRDEELAAFRERHKDNQILMQSLDEVGNPFGARLNIQAIDTQHYDKIAKFIASRNSPTGGGSNLIDQISYKKDIVDKMTRLVDTSQRLGLVISLVLILLSIFVVFNTISLAIYTSREEISVMRLVGAGNTYVKGPFVVEGVIAGVIASFLAMVLLYPSVIWVRNATAGVYGGLNLLTFYADNFGKIFLILFATGIVLGLLASYWATREYAQV